MKNDRVEAWWNAARGKPVCRASPFGFLIFHFAFHGSGEEAALHGGGRAQGTRRGPGRIRDGALSQGRGAARAEIFVEFATGKDEEKFFAHRLRDFALRTIEFAGGESSKLFLHGGGSEAREGVDDVPRHMN